MKSISNIQTHSLNKACLLLIISLLAITFSTIQSFADEQSISTLKTELKANDISNTTEDIQFSPKVGEEYTFTVTTTNFGSEPIDVSVFPSIAVSTSVSIDYVKKTDNLLNEDYDLTNYVSLTASNEEFEDGIIRLEANESKDVHITINANKELNGEVIGGINFSQVIGYQENEDSVNVQQVYQKVFVVRLKMHEATNDNKAQLYGDFEFNNTQNKTSLTYYNYNNNSLVSYAEGEAYKVINPDNIVIAEGELEKDTVVLTPYTKTQLSVPLLDGAELVSGDYQFIIINDNREKVTTFNYFEDKVEELAKKVDSSSNSIVLKSQNNVWLIVALIFVSAMFVFTVAKSYLKNKA